LPHEHARRRARERIHAEIAPHPRPQPLGFPHVQHLSRGVLEQVHAGGIRKVGKLERNLLCELCRHDLNITDYGCCPFRSRVDSQARERRINRSNTVRTSGTPSAAVTAKYTTPYGMSVSTASRIDERGPTRTRTPHAAAAAIAAASHKRETSDARSPVRPIRALSVRLRSVNSTHAEIPADAVSPPAPQRTSMPSRRGSGIANRKPSE